MKRKQHSVSTSTIYDLPKDIKELIRSYINPMINIKYFLFNGNYPIRLIKQHNNKVVKYDKWYSLSSDENSADHYDSEMDIVYDIVNSDTLPYFDDDKSDIEDEYTLLNIYDLLEWQNYKTFFDQYFRPGMLLENPNGITVFILYVKKEYGI